MRFDDTEMGTMEAVVDIGTQNGVCIHVCVLYAFLRIVKVWNIFDDNFHSPVLTFRHSEGICFIWATTSHQTSQSNTYS